MTQTLDKLDNAQNTYLQNPNLNITLAPPEDQNQSYASFYSGMKVIDS